MWEKLILNKPVTLQEERLWEKNGAENTKTVSAHTVWNTQGYASSYSFLQWKTGEKCRRRRRRRRRQRHWCQENITGSNYFSLSFLNNTNTNPHYLSQLSVWLSSLLIVMTKNGEASVVLDYGVGAVTQDWLTWSSRTWEVSTSS